MKLIVYNDDKTTTNYEIKKENFSDKSLKDRVFYIASNSKEQNALKIFYSYFSGAKSILFDSSNKILQKELEDLNIPDFKASIKVENIFDKYDFSFLYYTSGSTGYPTAALKTKENISSEVEDLTALLSSYKIKRVIVTVPFIHIYGSLFGLFTH